VEEGENRITEDEVRTINDGIDAFMESLGEEKEQLDSEEEALLASIEWEIRLRSREAQISDPKSKAARFEEWLDAGQVSAHWLLSYSDRLLPEEAGDHEMRSLSQDCAEFLWVSCRKEYEIDGTVTEEMFRDWYLIWHSYHPLTAGVNLVTVRACIKRMLFVHKRGRELFEVEYEVHPRHNRQWYEELLGLYRLVGKYAEEEASGAWKDLEPPPPF